ncbi:MAG: DUF4439 domain-containing protein [Pseudonocardiaceae bacterium]|nr:DUF4439 domain-containing protein [Pseudonocardiaceae bacterium]
MPTRRTILRACVLTGLSVPLVTSCGGGEEKPDELLALAAAARRDARDAARLAKATPELRQQLDLVTTTRRAHATTLQSEIDREHPPDEDDPKPGPARGKAGSVEALAQALDEAERSATQLIPRLPAYRAGLVGSVAGACASLRGLAPELSTERDNQEEPELEHLEPAGTIELPAESVQGLQQALATEHAAMWVYGLVSAFLPADFAEALDRAAAEHRARRDATKRMLTSASATPRPAEPAYQPPKPVNDEASATGLVVTAEADATVAWRGVLERTDNRQLRGLALRALVSSAKRGSLWRAEAGQTPSVVALPGKPGR